ncbi:hypothetical protein CPter91_3292 [Collimonas pratensis]|uniref:Uncharacterized protein n=1 Tax=Collimonas pratensis TaxID=279113 RepID=A0A127Q6C6_9BURK|nr:hypothetical protein CPter91_3292 [Collimonas pratensis]
MAILVTILPSAIHNGETYYHERCFIDATAVTRYAGLSALNRSFLQLRPCSSKGSRPVHAHEFYRSSLQNLPIQRILFLMKYRNAIRSKRGQP